MSRQENQPNVPLTDPELAFDAWFGQTLRSIYEPVMHESLPDQLVALLQQPPRQN